MLCIMFFWFLTLLDKNPSYSMTIQMKAIEKFILLNLQCCLFYFTVYLEAPTFSMDEIMECSHFD